MTIHELIKRSGLTGKAIAAGIGMPYNTWKAKASEGNPRKFTEDEARGIRSFIMRSTVDELRRLQAFKLDMYTKSITP